MTGEHLDRFLNDKWTEESELMFENRQKFYLLADATTIPQLVLLSTMRSHCRKRRVDHNENELILPVDGEHTEKRRRQN